MELKHLLALAEVLRIGEKHQHAGRYEAAVRAYVHVAALLGTDKKSRALEMLRARISILIANVWVEQGKLAAAEDIYTNGFRILGELERDVNDPEWLGLATMAWHLRGRCYVLQDKIVDAIKTLEEAAALAALLSTRKRDQGGLAEIACNAELGEALMKASRPGDAIRAFEKSFEVSKSCAEVGIGSIVALLAAYEDLQRRFSEAYPVAMQLLKVTERISDPAELNTAAAWNRLAKQISESNRAPDPFGYSAIYEQDMNTVPFDRGPLPVKAKRTPRKPSKATHFSEPSKPLIRRETTLDFDILSSYWQYSIEESKKASPGQEGQGEVKLRGVKEEIDAEMLAENSVGALNELKGLIKEAEAIHGRELLELVGSQQLDLKSVNTFLKSNAGKVFDDENKLKVTRLVQDFRNSSGCSLYFEEGKARQECTLVTSNKPRGTGKILRARTVGDQAVLWSREALPKLQFHKS